MRQSKTIVSQPQPAQPAQGAPRAQTAPQASQSLLGGQPVPTTRAEVEALQMKRAQISDQLRDLGLRRSELAKQRLTVDGSSPAAKSLDARIVAMDERAARLEQQLFQSDEALATATSQGVAVGRGAGGGGRSASTTFDDRVERAIRSQVEDSVFESFTIAAFCLVGATLLYRGFKRVLFKRKPASPLALPDYSVRFDQLQQSMDVMSIEVERISEAQRYMAKVLTDNGITAGEEAKRIR